MKRWIQRIASLKLTVALLMLIMAVLAAGTIVESLRDAEAAGRLVYGSLWFRVLLAILALNLTCSLVDLWPWGRYRIGFALTHISVLLVLAGSLVTDQLKLEGRLAIWEGEESRTVYTAPPAPGNPTTLALPFFVQLDSFEIDYYQGTRRPAMFRSRVTVRDPSSGQTFPAVIEMNRELAHAGYRLFQTSYRQTPGRDQTILSVAWDPGQPIVFVGYVLLVAGMLVVFSTRIIQRRAIGRPTRHTSRLPGALGLGIGLFAGLLAAASARAASVPDPGTVASLRRLPVQHDGRVMPLDTVARQAVLEVTGRRSLWGTDPVALVLGWAFDAANWEAEPVVRVGGDTLKQAIGLPAGTHRASFRELIQNQRLMRLAGEARASQQQERPLAPLLKQALEVEGRLSWVQQFFRKSIFRVVPSRDSGASWSVPVGLTSLSDLLAVLNSGAAARFVSAAIIEREITYNWVRPSRLAWLILALATGLSVLAWNVSWRWPNVLAGIALAAAVGVMSWGLAMRWMIAGRIPASNMYESLLFLGWGVGFFALAALLFLRNRMVILDASAMAAITMALTDLLPIDPFIHPMPPVLSGTPWLAIHVPIIMVGYAVFALGVIVAHMQIGFETFAPGRHDLSARMSDHLYWYILIGSILLLAGILTGSIWAADSWGRYWGWDPKEVWSLVAFLAYLTILHARSTGLLGPFGVAAFSIAAFWTILMTYIGVNFVLASGLHSYGFGESGVVRWMTLVAAVEIAYLTLGVTRHRGFRNLQERGRIGP
jgi:cytochrome c-type biogenesis protein CcsB